MSARGKERPLSRQLEVLGSAVASANERARECELGERRATAELARLQDAIVEAHADADEASAAKAAAERDRVESVELRDARERLEGARRAAQRATVEHATFATANLDALIKEVTPAAVAAAGEVTGALERLDQAHRQWQAVQSDVAALLRLAGRDTRDIPEFPQRLTDLVRDARRAGGLAVPPPVPGGQLMVPAPSPAEAPAVLPKRDAAQKPRRSREAA